MLPDESTAITRRRSTGSAAWPGRAPARTASASAAAATSRRSAQAPRGLGFAGFRLFQEVVELAGETFAIAGRHLIRPALVALGDRGGLGLELFLGRILALRIVGARSNAGP